jgi:hypothetical protein
VTLREKQSAFAALIPRLIDEALFRGYAVTLGEAWRSPDEAARLAKLGTGIRASLHCDRLAIDLNFFVDGVYQTSSDAHQAIGEWWERQSCDDYRCCWGGRFGDANHYSISHAGRK